MRFCNIVEPYITLYYSIKNVDKNQFCHVMREIVIIFQAPAVSKRKYASGILRQLHIFDIGVADPILQEV